MKLTVKRELLDNRIDKPIYKVFNEGKTIEISARKTKNIYFDFLNTGIVTILC